MITAVVVEGVGMFLGLEFDEDLENYAEVDDEAMRSIHDAVKVFFRSDRAQVTLWPAIDAQSRAAGAEALLAQFEEE